MPDQRVYGKTAGQSSTFYFYFLDPESVIGDVLPSSPTIAAGDARISVNGGNFSDTANTPVWIDEGLGSITLTQSEMMNAIINVVVKDASATQEWLPVRINIHTGGDPNNALHTGQTT